MATNFLQFPLGDYAAEQPFWLSFYVAKYSLINKERTRDDIQSRAFGQIVLPLPKDVGYELEHKFEEGGSPINPMQTVVSSVANNGGWNNFQQIKERQEDAPGLFKLEFATATSTYRRFSNITELTLVSEARKRYRFDYILVPKNASESVAIENIVGAFRNTSYPVVAGGLPERTYPQNLWTLVVAKNSGTVSTSGDLTADWLGEPLPCVLRTVVAKKNDRADPIVRILPNGYSNFTLLTLVFDEFETGTYDPDDGQVLSKSEISYKYFGFTP